RKPTSGRFWPTNGQQAPPGCCRGVHYRLSTSRRAFRGVRRHTRTVRAVVVGGFDRPCYRRSMVLRKEVLMMTTGRFGQAMIRTLATSAAIAIIGINSAAAQGLGGAGTV